MDIDITSLLDILVILLVFLLKSYNASNLKLNLVDHLRMANSDSRRLGQHAIIVQLDQHKHIWINNEDLGTYETANHSGRIDQKIQSIKGKEDKIVNLVFDKKTPYAQMNKVMDKMASLELAQFKFIVKGNY